MFNYYFINSGSRVPKSFFSANRGTISLIKIPTRSFLKIEEYPLKTLSIPSFVGIITVTKKLRSFQISNYFGNKIFLFPLYKLNFLSSRPQPKALKFSESVFSENNCFCYLAENRECPVVPDFPKINVANTWFSITRGMISSLRVSLENNTFIRGKMYRKEFCSDLYTRIPIFRSFQNCI